MTTSTQKMISNINILAQTEIAALSGGIMQIIIIGIMFAGMWFLLIAPQRRRQKQHQDMIDSLSVGEEILTIGGIFGIITNIKSDRITIKTAGNGKIEISRTAVQSRVNLGNKTHKLQ